MMGNVASKLRIHKFGNGDPLHSLTPSTQVNYLIGYFHDLSASSILEEPNYFDRDYLAEFSAFYGISSKGYPNVCKRLHVFSITLKREMLRKAASGNTNVISRFRRSYLGFIVLRPIQAAPLGRTVVVWYPENYPATPRVTEPARTYSVHISGFTLLIKGLAWQQQDTGVGACATVGLWTMLHSSAFDDHHSIPTTAQITESAHHTASLGSRVFPSKGLTIHQICEAVKSNKLAPIVFDGDIKDQNGRDVIGFTNERFSAACTSLIRSGYPVLIIGNLEDIGGHAVCAVGFRSCIPNHPGNAGTVSLEESDIQYIYIHDDNIGPNVRFAIEEDANRSFVRLTSSPPPVRGNQVRPTINQYPAFIPTQLVVAVHEDLRTSPDQINQDGYRIATNLYALLANVLKSSEQEPIPLSFSTRFIKLSEYLEEELKTTLGSNKSLLSRTRLALWENVPPMSLHIGMLRIGIWDGTPLVDVLFDTTDSDRNHPVFAHISYAQYIPVMTEYLTENYGFDFGICVKSF
jgi:hypothetical protein